MIGIARQNLAVRRHRIKLKPIKFKLETWAAKPHLSNRRLTWTKIQIPLLGNSSSMDLAE